MKCMQSCCVIVQWHQIKLAWWWKVLKNCEITDSHGTFCNWSNLPWRSTLSSKTHSPSLSIQSEVRQKPDNQSNMCFHPSFPTLRLLHTITTFFHKNVKCTLPLHNLSNHLQSFCQHFHEFVKLCEALELGVKLLRVWGCLPKDTGTDTSQTTRCTVCTPRTSRTHTCSFPWWRTWKTTIFHQPKSTTPCTKIQFQWCSGTTPGIQREIYHPDEWSCKQVHQSPACKQKRSNQGF